LRQQLEQNVADVLGIKKFYCDFDIETSSSYEALKRNILKQFNSNKNKNKTDWSSLNIRVCNTYPKIEATTGTIIVPLDATPSDIMNFLVTNSGATLQQFRVFKDGAEQVKNLFSIPSLTYQIPPELNDDQLWECLCRLSKGHYHLLPYLKGVKLHVANEYGINEEANVLSIRWDYLVD